MVIFRLTIRGTFHKKSEFFLVYVYTITNKKKE